MHWSLLMSLNCTFNLTYHENITIWRLFDIVSSCGIFSSCGSPPILTDGAARKAGLSSRKGTQCTPQTLSLSSSCFFSRNVKGKVTNRSRKGHETKFIDEFCWVKIAFRQIVVLPGDITCDIWTCYSHFCRQTASLIAAVMYKAGLRCLTTSYRPGNDMLPQCLLAVCVLVDLRIGAVLNKQLWP